jgi:formylglycine-generating enzyme
MRRRMLAIALLWKGCGGDSSSVSATGVELRVQVEPALRNAASGLSVRTSRLRTGRWREETSRTLPAESIRVFPIDLAVKGDERDVEAAVELVVRAVDERGAALAEARAVTSFVPRRIKLLELDLRRCGDLLCEGDPNCHGSTCTTCRSNGCESTGFAAGELLSDFDSNAAISDNYADPSVVRNDDGDASSAVVVLGVDASTDAGNPTSDAEPAAPACEPGAARCQGNTVEHCRDSAWRADPPCDHSTCSGGRCVGNCAPGEGRCIGAFGKTAEQCNELGQFVLNRAEAEAGACEHACESGHCVDTCGASGERTCSALVSGLELSCQGGVWRQGLTCPQRCADGSGCVLLPSCTADPRCGPDRESCCATRDVPGGDFTRASADPLSTVDAHVEPFTMDRFEVTASRYRAYLASYDAWRASGHPRQGAGSHGNELGWNKTWEVTHLPATRAELEAQTSLGCGSSLDPANQALDSRPMNCVTWYEAYAFCVWDGGRLPTEAERLFAASGGREQRLFPWLASGDRGSATAERAVFSRDLPASGTAVESVGSRSPAGDGRWAHADLAGNVVEWVVDTYHDSYSDNFCANCADTGPESDKVVAGGSVYGAAWNLQIDYRTFTDAASRFDDGGFRCVYEL